MQRPRSMLLLLCLALAAPAIAACGGGDAEAEPTATAGPTSTREPPAAEIPARPDDFAQYAGVVAQYLTAAGDAALQPPCLGELMAAWVMAEPDVTLAPEERCLTGNTDADPDDEVVAVFTSEPAGEGQFGLLSNVVVFDSTPDGYDVDFESWQPDEFPDLMSKTIVAAEDVTGDGNGNLVYTSTTCGAHTCTLYVHVVDGAGPQYARMTPPDGLLMPTADVSLEDRDGDGVPEVLLHGGTIGSVGAGPQRTRTEVYAWNGASYELAETIFDSSDLLYFAVLDADDLFDAGAYLEAAGSYLDTIENTSLQESGYRENERAELGAYAQLRRALALLAGGGSASEANDAMAQARIDYPGALNLGLINAFRGAYDVSDNLHAGCLAARDHMDATLAAYEEAWYYGYSNPEFDPERVCPF